jgi:hypothetical protein
MRQLLRNIYIWTLLYDADAILRNAFEKLCFNDSYTIDYCGSRFTYHRRTYRAEIITDAKYAGGVDEYACWLDKADLLRGLALAGYCVKRLVPDMVDGVPALNLWASRN